MRPRYLDLTRQQEAKTQIWPMTSRKLVAHMCCQHRVCCWERLVEPVIFRSVERGIYISELQIQVAVVFEFVDGQLCDGIAIAVYEFDVGIVAAGKLLDRRARRTIERKFRLLWWRANELTHITSEFFFLWMSGPRQPTCAIKAIRGPQNCCPCAARETTCKNVFGNMRSKSMDSKKLK